MTTLARRLGLTDAVMIGLGSMVGAGVFAVWSPGVAAAGGGVLVALGIAALVAYANATSSAQLAAKHPTSGGTYVYGRAELGEWWGFLAGWGFVIGKTASCVAMALTVAAYVVGDPLLQRVVAVALVVAVAAVNLRGVTRTALATRIIVAIVLVVLLGFLAVLGGQPGIAGLSLEPTSAYGLLQAAGLLFFAFAGYARIATLGEEVVEPRRTIPRAIVLALALVVLLYAAVGFSVLRVLPLDVIAASPAPLAEAARRSLPWAEPFVRGVAALAATGALLALLAGVGRTVLAMARNHDLPAGLTAVHPRFQVPHRAELLVAAVVAVVALAVDLRGAIGFSSFGVLLYYTVANLAAFRQPDQRLYPRWLQVFGALGCLVLVVTLPWQSVAAGVVMYALGVGYRLVRQRGQGS